MTSRAIDQDIHNIVMVTAHRGKMLTFNFHSTKKQFPQIVLRPQRGAIRFTAFYPMSNELPSANASTAPGEHEGLRRIVSQRGLCGLANDTKWDELLSAMRLQEGWRPRFRWKCLDGVPCPWDTEWCYHPPFPFISVEWFDLSLSAVPEESAWLMDLVESIGFDHQRTAELVRIFGYSPRSFELLDKPYWCPDGWGSRERARLTGGLW